MKNVWNHHLIIGGNHRKAKWRGEIGCETTMMYFLGERFTYPLPAGIFESMVFRTSRLVGPMWCDRSLEGNPGDHFLESSINMTWEEPYCQRRELELIIYLVVSTPLKNMLVKLGSSSPNIRGKKKYLSCQHLDDVCFFRWLLKLKQSLELGPIDINKGALFPCLGHWSLSRVTYLQSTSQFFTTTFDRSHCCHRNNMVKLLGGKYPDVHINHIFGDEIEWLIGLLSISNEEYPWNPASMCMIHIKYIYIYLDNRACRPK